MSSLDDLRAAGQLPEAVEKYESAQSEPSCGSGVIDATLLLLKADAAILSLAALVVSMQRCGICRHRDWGGDGEKEWPVCGTLRAPWDYPNALLTFARKQGFVVTDKYEPDEVACDDRCHWPESKWEMCE